MTSTSAAEFELRRARSRRHRERLRAGKACYVIEGDGALLDLLVWAHWIAEEALTDRKAVEAALTAMLLTSADDLSGAAHGRCPHCGREW